MVASDVNSGVGAQSASQLAAMLVMPSTQLKQPVTVRNAYMYDELKQNPDGVLPQFYSHGNGYDS